MKRILSFGIVFVLLLGCVGAVSANLVKNGGFETVNPVSNGLYLEPLYPGSQKIAPWSIGGNSIDLYGNAWKPASGSYSIDLAGYAAGTISQNLDTTAGEKYDLSFMIAGNDIKNPVVKTFEVKWGGTSLGTFTFDTTGKNADVMGWERREIKGLVASSPSTTLEFIDLTGTAYGTALDDIVVETADILPAPEFPSSFLPATMIIGFLGAVLFIQRTREH